MLPASHTCTNTIEMPVYAESWIAVKQSTGELGPDATAEVLNSCVEIGDSAGIASA